MVATRQRICATMNCGRALSQGTAGDLCRVCYEVHSVASQQRAKSSIVVYTVNCPDCNRTGRIAVEGEPAMNLDMLFCPDCPPDTPPMEVLFKGKPI